MVMFIIWVQCSHLEVYYTKLHTMRGKLSFDLRFIPKSPPEILRNHNPEKVLCAVIKDIILS